MIIIIHGTFSTPTDNWFPWLKKELNAITPTFPTPENQNLTNWLDVMKNYKITKDTILIGHSSGATFILSLLEKYECKAAFLVAGFTGKLNISLDPLNKTFAEKEFDWEKIKENCKQIYMFHSDNDPYVPLENAKNLQEHLNAKLTIIPNGQHLNKTAGFTKFPLLLKKIKEI